MSKDQKVGASEVDLGLGAEEGARRLLLGRLDSLEVELNDFASRGASLHDLRVSVRRYRALARAFKHTLGRARTSRFDNRLRTLCRDAGPERDREVLADWFASVPNREVEAPAAAHERQKIQRHVQRLLEMVPTHRQRLAVFREPRDLRRSDPTLGDAWFAAASTAVQRLRVAAHRAVESQKNDDWHRARVRAKRLRYLLDVGPAGGSIADSIGRLRGMQDQLGDARDASFCAAWALRHGLDDDASALESRARSLTAEVTANTPALLEKLEECLKSVLADFSEPVEIERKYLLSALPPICKKFAPHRIAQGYIPGIKIAERLRHTEHPNEQHSYARTVKLGQGASRFEFEETIDEDFFRRAWPLTQSARLIKNRYRIPIGELTFEVDEFLDRHLVLLEVELPSEGHAFELPSWAAALVVRDVTDESEFVNLKLARPDPDNVVR